MDRFEQASAKLRACVLSCTKGCALERARKGSNDCRALSAIAQEDFGFTKYEAYGVMNGWDEAAGHHGAFRDFKHEPGFEAGRELGEALYCEVYPRVLDAIRAITPRAKQNRQWRKP